MTATLPQHQRSHSLCGVFVIGLCLLFSSLPSMAASAVAFEWLASKSNPDGSYAQASDIATPYQATSEVLRAARRYNQAPQINAAAAQAFITAETLTNTETLSRKIIAAAEAGSGVSTLVDELKILAQADGGFGAWAGFQSTALDTAFALHALHAAGYDNTPAAMSGLQYLLNAQQADGGWAISANESGAYVTAMAVIALSPYKAMFSEVPSRLNAAHNFLLAKRDGIGLWGEDYASASILIALLSDGADASLLRAGAEALANRQASNGSWSDDVFSTALALRALALYNAADSGASGTQAGTLVGYVVKENGHEPMANVELSLASVAGYAVLSDSTGFFKMTGVPVGTQTIVAHKSGYYDLSRVVTIAYDQIAEAGTLALASDPAIGSVIGRIEASLDQAAIEGASVTLTGPQGASIRLSDANGHFEWTALPPGDYAVQIDKSGYYPVTGVLTVAGGASVALNQSLIKVGTYLDDTPADVVGKLVDAESGQPLSGAHIEIFGGATAVTGSDGAFVFKALPRGSYQALLTADGYQSQALAFVFSPGAAGDLGELRLYRFGGTVVPSMLALSGRVIDGLNGTAIANATVEWLETGEKVSTGTDGTFAIAGIDTLSFTLAINAPSFAQKTFGINVTGFGEVFQEFSLPPDNSDSNATTSALSGLIKDNVSGLPIAGAKVTLQSGQGGTITTGSTGQFEFTGITDLNFSLNVTAEGYFAATRQLNLAAYGNYETEIVLEPQTAAVESFQIVSLTPPPQAAGANETLLFSTDIANLLDTDQEATVLGEIVNAEGMPIATVSPYAPGTTEPVSQFHFAANESKTLTVPWLTAQAAPGAYRLILRVIKPGTIDRSLPFGQILAENQAFGEIVAISAFGGALDLNPPLLQAGSQTPVKLDVFIGNIGNTGLSDVPLTLTIEQPGTGTVLHQATTTLDTLAVNDYRYLSFGEWMPTAEGNLPLKIRATEGQVSGEITGTLYVGDKASGAFTVDKTVVPEGTQNVQAKITLEGVDTALGTLIDPLYFAVKQAVITGGEYTAKGALQWQKTNRCLGCHIQTQSLVGVAAAYQKGLGDKASANKLYNTIASSQQEDGGLRANHPYYTKTQTALGLWSLTQWDDLKESFRTLYQAAKHLYARRSQSGNQTWWTRDYAGGWWTSNEAHTALTVKGFVKLLEASKRLDLTTVSDYSLQSLGNLGGSGSNNFPLDLEAGPDGLIYNIKRNGQIVQIDPANGVTQVIGSSGHNSYGLAIDEDGTQFIVGDNGRLTRRNPDGGFNSLLSGGGTFTDVEIGPDGLLYIIDYSNHRLLRLADPDSGQVQVVAQGGLLSNPYSLAFDAEGNAIIANYGGWNIIKVEPNGAASVFADGLQYRPVWIAADQQGGFYYSSLEYSNSGQATPSGINYLSQNGVIERLKGGNTLRGAVVLNQQAYVASYNGNQLYEIVEAPINAALLANYANEVTRAANYFLARHKDNSSDNIVQAMRLTGLAEARKVITDSTLSAQVDSAVVYIEQVLRARQRTDGGWGRYTNSSSDAMVTALVGLALDYTNPSSDDPMVRKTIQYLLSQQQGDHSWKSNNGILSTRLAATSLVVAYLPVALERLGGIDVDLHLATPANINLLQPSIAPTSQTPGDNNQSHYLWQLLGVTSNSRELAFNLDLLDMVLGEERPVASEAYIQFKNSFNSELVRVDLAIPAVRGGSELSLQVATDKTTYQANEPVVIDLGVDNTGPTAAEGYIELMIRAVGSTDALANLAPLTVTTIPAGEQMALTSNWMTGTTLAGNYEVFARLFDTQDRLLDQQTAPFEIVHGDSPVIDGRVTTDKPLYQAWDQVRIDGRIENISANAIQPPTRYELIVSDPTGQVILTQSGQINELVAGALQDRQFELALVDALQGQYSVTWLIQDGFSRELLATRMTAFTVERHILQGITGQVQANPMQVYQGDSLQCLEQVTNLAAGAVAGLTLTSQVVSVESNQVIREFSRIQDLIGGQTFNEQRDISTDSLAIGEYACILNADIDGKRQQIGAALFAVLEPPIKIEGQLGTGDRGRVLVLLDEAPKHCDGFSLIGLEAVLETPLTTGTPVTATLYDPNGALIDQETGLLDERLIDQNLGSGGINLILDDIAPDHIAASVSAVTALGQGYRLTVSAENGMVTLDSGLIATDCHDTLMVGTVQGDLRLTDVQKLPAANDPFGPNHVPDLASQRTMLETLLSEAGWSYTITTNADDFTRELRSGGYATYLLLSEHVKLDETVQKELREAVYRGEGLVEAGGHDQRQGRLDEVLGLKFLGKHPGTSGVTVLASEAHMPGELWFSLTDRALKADSLGADILGTFSGTEAVAMTTRRYGDGRADYFGFDLLAEAALPGADPLYADLLLDALAHVHPDSFQPLAGGVYPLHLQLTNQGISTAGQAVLTLPAGVGIVDKGTATVSNHTLIWPFELLPDQTLVFDSWISLPADPVQITALIQTGISPDFKDYTTLTLALDPLAALTLEEILSDVQALDPAIYKQVIKYLHWAIQDQANGDTGSALAALLRASDALIAIGPGADAAVRLRIAEALRSLAQQL